MAVLAIVGAGWFALMGGEYSTFDWMRLRDAHLAEVRAIEELSGEVDSLAGYLDLILHDPAMQERVARERFGMIRDGEILYRLVPSN